MSDDILDFSNRSKESSSRDLIYGRIQKRYKVCTDYGCSQGRRIPVINNENIEKIVSLMNHFQDTVNVGYICEHKNMCYIELMVDGYSPNLDNEVESKINEIYDRILTFLKKYNYYRS